MSHAMHTKKDVRRVLAEVSLAIAETPPPFAVDYVSCGTVFKQLGNTYSALLRADYVYRLSAIISNSARKDAAAEVKRRLEVLDAAGFKHFELGNCHYKVRNNADCLERFAKGLRRLERSSPSSLVQS